jgi:methionyl-tRNA synthetase
VRDAFYITTPIYYVNGTPHIGHAYTTTAADAAAEYMRMKGLRVRFLTGTDEHGQKVLEAAEKRGMTPTAHCDDMVVRWRGMMEALGIRHDRFIRTTDDDHVAVVKTVLQQLYDRGEIYQDTYTGWYSTAAERFWTEKDLVDGKCPDSGQPVQEITETNYFFRMSKYSDTLLEHIEANPDYIRPLSRRNEVLGFLKKGLGDLCISRPKSRMSWGIDIPFDAEYVTYVWFDALLNYLTGAGFKGMGDDSHKAWWPAVHLLGKDILTTHAVYWSTMLLAMGVDLPAGLFAHGWWVAGDGRKMSKSLGNTIDVGLLSESFGVDATRYFFLREIAFGADGNFTYEGFLSRYNVDLANDIGNLAHRGLSMTTNWLGGVVPAAGPSTEAEAHLDALAGALVPKFDAAMGKLDFKAAVEAVLELIGTGNKYVDTTAPWALNKAGSAERLATVLRNVLEICYLAATLLLPIMPERSRELLRRLGKTDEDATATLRALVTHDGSPLTPRHLTPGATLDVADQLFPRHRNMPPAIAAILEATEDEQPAPPPKKKKKKKKKRGADNGPKPPISFEDFGKLELRAGTILSADPHPNADKLLVVKVDVGEPEPRTVVAGIRSRFEPADIVGRQVVVVVNLEPAELRGVRSEGMLLAAGAGSIVDLVSVAAPAGTVVR